jgi:hypothetical protein
VRTITRAITAGRAGPERSAWPGCTPRALADLKAGGTRLALLSSAGPDYGSYFRHGPFGDFFAACYVSGAEAVGITGHLFTGVTALRAFLVSLRKNRG